MMTAADLATLRFNAHAIEATNGTGVVFVPQHRIRVWEAEILAFRSMNLEQFIDWSITRVTP
jgi:hypothetical protein